MIATATPDLIRAVDRGDIAVSVAETLTRASMSVTKPSVAFPARRRSSGVSRPRP